MAVKKVGKLDEKENEARKAFLDYIQSIYLSNGYSKTEISWSVITAQIKNMLSENKSWNHAQLKYVLFYIYEIEQKNLFTEESNGSIISLIPFYYEKAKEFGFKTQQIKNAIKDFDFDDSIITIKKGNVDRTNKLFKEINMGDII